MGHPRATKAAAVGAAISVQAVFATYQILGKELLDGGLNPIAFALLRELGSAAIFLTAVRLLVPRAGLPLAVTAMSCVAPSEARFTW